MVMQDAAPGDKGDRGRDGFDGLDGRDGFDGVAGRKGLSKDFSIGRNIVHLLHDFVRVCDIVSN